MNIAPTVGSATAAAAQEIHDLSREQEFRFEVDWQQSSIQLELLEGTAEIYGNELAVHRSYAFSAGAKLAVFTWHGCRLRVTGPCRVAYVATETPMQAYLNLHLALEGLRRPTVLNTSTDTAGIHEGPRVMVVGAEDCGKTTLCRLLVNYALRMNWKPLFVDLDPRDGTLMMPTCLGVVAVDHLDVEEWNGFLMTSSPPLLYQFGHDVPAVNFKVFQRIVGHIATLCDRRNAADAHVRHSGWIVDTPTWSEETSPALLSHCITAFGVDAVVVVGQERLYNEIQKSVASQSQSVGKPVRVIRVPKSEGVQMKRVREYFYGTPRFELAPYSSSVAFAEIAVRRIGEAYVAPDSALPIGADRQVDETELLALDIGGALLHTILAVSNADLPYPAGQADEQTLIETNLAGFVYVSEVDERKKRVKLLCPNAGKLPKRYLWLGNLRWVET